MATPPKPRRTRAAPYKHVDRVEVHLWGQLMGAVALDPSYGFYAFAYAPSFIAKGIEPAPLRMPLREEPYIFTDLPRETYKALPALLSDALPDDFGNALINKYMADRGIPANQVSEIDRAGLHGQPRHGRHGVQAGPRGPSARSRTPIELSDLVSEARKAVAGTIEDDEHTDAALRSIIDVGTSAGGARAKAVIAWKPDNQRGALRAVRSRRWFRTLAAQIRRHRQRPRTRRLGRLRPHRAGVLPDGPGRPASR